MKTTINKQIDIESRPMKFNRTAPNFQKLIPDFIKNYPDAIEEMDASFPSIFGPLLQIVFLVDADYAHDLKTHRSTTGLNGYLGSKLVILCSKRQDSIASSTYSAEFSALHMAIEEDQSLRYILRCLGCNVPVDGSLPTRIFGDDLSVILNSQNPTCDISKKHAAMSSHVARKVVTARIVEPYWLRGHVNTSDNITKKSSH